MEMVNRLVGAAGKLKARIAREWEYLTDVIQCLVLIVVIDEFCYVKLTNKRDLLRSVLSRRQTR
jgi:hypothetical protein